MIIEADITSDRVEIVSDNITNHRVVFTIQADIHTEYSSRTVSLAPTSLIPWLKSWLNQ